MESLSSRINSTNLTRCNFISQKGSSISAKWFFFVPFWIAFVSDSQEQCLFLNAIQLFARCIYIQQVGPQKRFTSTAGCKILFTFTSRTGPVRASFRRKTQPWFGADGNIKGNLKRVGLKAFNSVKTGTIKAGLTLKNMAIRPFQLMRSAYNAIKSPRPIVSTMKTNLANGCVLCRCHS